MDVVDQAVQTSKALREKVLAGETPTAEEYATAINLQNQLANRYDFITGIMAIGIAKSMSVCAAGQGYKVSYNPDTDTFSVTEGAQN